MNWGIVGWWFYGILVKIVYFFSVFSIDLGWSLNEGGVLGNVNNDGVFFECSVC